MNALTTIATETATALPAHNMPRAIPLLQDVPEGCFPFRIEDERASPHIRIGDVAVVDPSDREPKERELFLIEYNAGLSNVRRIVETCHDEGITDQDGEALWWCRQVNNPRTWAEFDAWQKAGRIACTADGPYRFEGLAGRLLGKVIGVIPAENPPTLPEIGDELGKTTNYCDIIDDHALPYIHRGQVATVNQNQRAPFDGRLYAVQIKAGNAVIMKARQAAEGWYLSIPNSDMQTGPDAGPISPGNFPSIVSGLVTGVMTIFDL